MFITHALK